MSHKTYWEIPVTTLSSGYKLALPVHEIKGAQPGPKIAAATHHEEPPQSSGQRDGDPDQLAPERNQTGRCRRPGRVDSGEDGEGAG